MGLGTLAGRAPATVETAALVVSELVTNAVLHARTPVDLTLRWAGSQIRIEVQDDNGQVPRTKEYGPDAASGRGLLLVGSLSQEWGVHATASGKVVWSELRDEPAEPDAQSGGSGAALAGTEPERVLEVRILGLDLAVYLEAQEHNDALLREFAFLVESHPTDDIARQLVETAREVQESFATATADLRRQIQRAIESGGASVDLRMVLPESAWRRVAGLSRLLDEADVYCEEGNLLTLTSSARVRRFRKWYSDQVRSQLKGEPPTPWPASEHNEGAPVA